MTYGPNTRSHTAVHDAARRHRDLMHSRQSPPAVVLFALPGPTAVVIVAPGTVFKSGVPWEPGLHPLDAHEGLPPAGTIHAGSDQHDPIQALTDTGFVLIAVLVAGAVHLNINGDWIARALKRELARGAPVPAKDVATGSIRSSSPRS